METRTLKQAVRRNIDRFPTDFMFELTNVELDCLVSQIVMPDKKVFGGAKPFAFYRTRSSHVSKLTAQ
ncbi:ORF6N domain protein [compost metagenome]